MCLSDEVLADEGAKMVFTVPNTGSTYTVEVPVSEATQNGDYYVFTCEVAAKEITSTVSAQIVMSDGTKSDVFEYTVKQYAEVILQKAAEEKGSISNTGNTGSISANTYSKAAPLVKAMLNYGAAVQTYFGFKTDDLANDTEYMTDEERVVAPYGFAGAGYTIEGEEAGVTYYGTALVLESELAIKHYFVVEDGVDVESLELSSNYPATIKKNGNLYEVTISDIAAHNLAKNDCSVTLGGLTVNYGMFSYGEQAQINGSTAIKAVMNALAAYAYEATLYAM